MAEADAAGNSGVSLFKLRNPRVGYIRINEYPKKQRVVDHL